MFRRVPVDLTLLVPGMGCDACWLFELYIYVVPGVTVHAHTHVSFENFNIMTTSTHHTIYLCEHCLV